MCAADILFFLFVTLVVCVNSRGNSFSFSYINDLELLLNDLQNLLYMESEQLRRLKKEE